MMMAFCSATAYATFLDIGGFLGMVNYEGTMIEDIPSTEDTISGNVLEYGLNAHIYPIPLIPIGIGVFFSYTNFEKIEGDVFKDGVEFFSFSTEPTVMTFGGEIAINAPLAFFIDPYVRVGGGVLYGSAKTTLVAPANEVTSPLGIAGETAELDDMTIPGIFWHAYAGLKFDVGVPFLRIGAEVGYRSIIAMGIINPDVISSTPTGIDYDDFKDDLGEAPFVAAYESINGLFGRAALIFEF